MCGFTAHNAVLFMVIRSGNLKCMGNRLLSIVYLRPICTASDVYETTATLTLVVQRCLKIMLFNIKR